MHLDPEDRAYLIWTAALIGGAIVVSQLVSPDPFGITGAVIFFGAFGIWLVGLLVIFVAFVFLSDRAASKWRRDRMGPRR